MKKLLVFVAIISLVLSSVAVVFAKDVYVRGYTRSDGTYVAPYYRTAPNSTRNDNYSTQGNYNPYTGKAGTQPRDSYYGGSGSSYGSSSGSSYNSNYGSGLQIPSQNYNSYGY